MLKDFLINFVFPCLVSVVSYIAISYINSRSKAKKVNLREHYIFNRLNTVKSLNVDINFKLKNAEKEAVFREILRSQIDCILDEARLVVEDIEDNPKKFDNPSAIQERLTIALDHIFTNLYIFYLHNDSYSVDDKNTIKAVLDKFYTINKDRVDRLYDNILVINASVFYSTPEEKTYAFFDTLISLVLDQLSVAESSFNNINGDLRGLTFRGGVIR